MIFSADENIQHRAAKLLEVFDQNHEIRAHSAHFGQGTTDVVILKEIAAWEPKPTFLSGDGRILKNKAEIVTLREADISFVYFASGWTNLHWNDYAWKLIRVWPRITARVSAARFPSIFVVSVRSLKVESVRRLSDLR